MNANSWDLGTQDTYASIRKYRRAFDRFLRAVPTPELSRRRFDAALFVLENALRRPEVGDRLGVVIDAGLASCSPGVSSVASTALDRLSLDIELKLASSYGLRPKAVRSAIETTDPPASDSKLIQSADGLISTIHELHMRAVIEVEASRYEADRVTKKRRKRDVKRSVISALFGTGCTLGNSYSFPGMPPMSFSYAVALACFHQCVRDFVGDPPKDDE